MSHDKRGYKGGPIIAVAVLLLLAAYAGAYFALSEFDGGRAPMRTFNAEWQVTFFRPALMIEKCCRGVLLVSWPVGGFTIMRRVE